MHCGFNDNMPIVDHESTTVACHNEGQFYFKTTLKVVEIETEL